MSRKAIPLKTKLAAALLQTVRPDANGNMARVISHEEAKRMTPDQIIARFHMDHDPIPHAAGGPDEPWNLTPRLVGEHQAKTSGRKGESRLVDQSSGDTPRLAKARRISRDHDEFRARLLAKDAGESPPEPRKRKVKIPSRPFPKRQKNPAISP